MRHVIAAALILCVGCQAPSFDGLRPASVAERPTVNVPLDLRQANWVGNKARVRVFTPR